MREARRPNDLEVFIAAYPILGWVGISLAGGVLLGTLLSGPNLNAIVAQTSVWAFMALPLVSRARRRVREAEKLAQLEFADSTDPAARTIGSSSIDRPSSSTKRWKQLDGTWICLEHNTKYCKICAP